MTSGFSKKIINLSRHSFAEKSHQNDRKTRRFSNINTQAVIYNNEQLQQLYTGLYLEENLHNVGTYRWLTGCDSHKYEGKLFINNLHGYGKLTYPDDSVYEGLFYFNKKFGPGVITYENKRQDVGIWNGNLLIRLCDKFSVSEYYRECIPKLSGMMQSKLYLLQFRHLIPITEKYNDSAKDILTKLGASERVLANKNILYSKLIRNPNSRFINGEKLYKNFFTYEDELHTTVDVVDHFDENNEPVIIKLDVCNLVAWNNEEINTIILKHAFLNRHYEKLLSFNIKDVLCTKRRGQFYPPGPIETKSQELIVACRSADPRQVERLIAENNLYPDVADCRGNNTVTYATLANQSNNIKVLSEFGANLDSFNDDCITPLIFAILYYIAIKYEITSTLWENAFIYAKAEYDLAPCNQQWPNPSTSSVTKECLESSQKSVSPSRETSNPSDTEINLVLPSDEKLSKLMERRGSLTSLLKDYILTLDCSHTKHAVHYRKTLNTELKFKKSFDSSKVNCSHDIFKSDETKRIMKTISTLLLCGADPNIGEVPFCPIITAIFSKSKDLIQMLISAKAIVNAKTCEYLGKLGPLHVIGSLSPCLEQLEMAYVFLENGAYVDDLSNGTHWLEEQTILLADKAPEGYLEKTPLHLVCMRYDFDDNGKDYLASLALLFIQYGANLSLQYLGHTPLTLAMMRGNTKLMKNLLETGLVDPNEGLGYNMGVPLTLCILQRYSKLLHSSLVKQLYQVLTEYYANPFNDVPNFNGNAIEFYYFEHIGLAHGRKNSFIKTHNGLLLLHYAKSILLKYIESKVVQILYQYKIICDLDSPLYNVIVKFLNSYKTTNILQILIDHDIIVENSSNIQKLLNFVEKRDTDGKDKFVNIEEDYKRFHFENYMPEIDPNHLKYKVCFECFRKTGRLLILCPKCEMIYFCSQECNTRSIKNPNSGHPCKESFYKKELMNIQANKRRTSNYDDLLHKSAMLYDLLSSGNINLKDFSRMKTKEKRRSIGKLKEQQRLDQLNAEDADKDSSGNKTGLDGGSSRKKRSRSRKSSSRRSASARGSRWSHKTRKSSRKSRSRRSTSDKRKSKRSSRSRYSRRSSSRRKNSRSTSTDFGENKYKKIKVNLKRNVLKSSSSVKDALQVFIGSKKPVIDIDKRNMYLTLRAQMLEKDRERNVRKSAAVQSECCTEKIKMDKNCTELMLQIAKRKIPNLPKDYEELDVKFWQIFSPYCIFQNGQLYYNFKEESNNVYYKITYSNV